MERSEPKATRIRFTLPREIAVFGPEIKFIVLLFNQNMRKALTVRIHAMLHRVFHQGHHHERYHLRLGIFKVHFELQVKGFVESELFEVRVLF